MNGKGMGLCPSLALGLETVLLVLVTSHRAAHTGLTLAVCPSRPFKMARRNEICFEDLSEESNFVHTFPYFTPSKASPRCPVSHGTKVLADRADEGVT